MSGKYAWLLLLITIFTSCGLHQSDHSPEPILFVRLQGVIHGTYEGPITLQVPDPLAYDEPLVLDTIELDSVGSFSISVAWSTPGKAELYFTEQYVPLYLMPGDTLHITYDLEADDAVFTGRGAAANTYLQDTERLKGEFALNPDLPPEAFLPRLDSLTAARQELLEALRPAVAAEHADHPFLPIAEVEIKASRIDELQQYPWIHQYVTNSKNAPVLPAGIQEEIRSFPLSNETWFESTAFQYMVNRRLSDMIRDTLKKEKSVYDQRHYRFADSLLTGRMRELQLAQVVQEALTYGSGLETGGILLERFTTSDPSSRYLPYLQGMYERAAKVAVGRSAPRFTAVDLQGNIVKSEDLQGNLVYLDIWASWCMPCRKAMPDLVQLAKDMKGKPVQVVMLSVDDDEASWRKLAEQNPGPRHLFIQGGLSNQFSKDYNLSGVPKYYLLDREGTILQNNGPYPSKAKEALEELLAKSKGSI